MTLIERIKEIAPYCGPLLVINDHRISGFSVDDLLKAVQPEEIATAGAYTWIKEAAEELKEGQRWYQSERAEALLSGVPVPNEDLGFESPADIAAALLTEAGKWKYRTDSEPLMEAGKLMERAAQALMSPQSPLGRLNENA